MAMGNPVLVAVFPSLMYVYFFLKCALVFTCMLFPSMKGLIAEDNCRSSGFGPFSVSLLGVHLHGILETRAIQTQLRTQGLLHT